MIAELGLYALALALGVALFQTLVPWIGANRRNTAMMVAAEPAAFLQLLLIGMAMAALIHAYVTSDFSVRNAFENSHSAKPLLYKISGVWGNHEGSMVLWVLILAVYGAAIAIFGRNLPPPLKARVLAVQGSIAVAFLTFILFTSNPFLRLSPTPIEGQGLNPLLQDPGLAFHPPNLYAGYVGLSVAFSFAIAALAEGRVDAAWARWVRPWTIVAWMFLTIGIAMGSWWAYYELGWGGWWFWDPVENASLMPWLVATALIHSAIVVEKRNALKSWTVLLAILAFSLSLTGTFLVRSGVLTSVHAFAVDPRRGLFILMILLVFIGGALGLYVWRAPTLKGGGRFAPVSREGLLVLNNLFLCTATAAVLTGTLYPLFVEVLGKKISVGPPYFNATFGPIFIPLLILVPIGTALSWKRGDLRHLLRRLVPVAGFAIFSAGLIVLFNQPGPWAAVFGLALGLWLVFGSVFEAAQRVALFKVSFSASLSRAFGLPRSFLAMLLAHAGLGVVVIGITAMTLWRVEVILSMKPGQSVDVGQYRAVFDGTQAERGANYEALAATFQLYRGDYKIGPVISEKRVFQPSGMSTTEVGLHEMMKGDVYIALGDTSGDGGRVVRLYYNPLINLLWLGAAMMFLGGLFTLSDRRFRVGAPKRSAVKLSPAPAE